MSSRKIRAYFDYNIYTSILARDIELIQSKNVDLFYSVAHVEEYYKALKNASEENYGELESLKHLLIESAKPGVILNPSNSRIRAVKEKFEVCYKRIEEFDTRAIVNDNGKRLYDINKESVAKLQTKDKEAKNNSNLNYKEIWERDELKKVIKDFERYYNQYENNVKKIMFEEYGLKALQLIKNIKLPCDFILKENCFKQIESFHLLEMIIEYLNNELCACGYNKDVDVRKTQSGIHDVSHMIYGTYCDYLVTSDKRFMKRAQAIYYFLGVDTLVVDYEEYKKMVTDLDIMER